MPRLLDMPEIVRATKARNSLSDILKRVDEGDTFIIEGPNSRRALVIDVDTFRELQESYKEVPGRLEARKLLDSQEDLEALEELQTSMETEEGELPTSVVAYGLEQYRAAQQQAAYHLQAAQQIIAMAAAA